MPDSEGSPVGSRNRIGFAYRTNASRGLLGNRSGATSRKSYVSEILYRIPIAFKFYHITTIVGPLEISSSSFADLSCMKIARFPRDLRRYVRTIRLLFADSPLRLRRPVIRAFVIPATMGNDGRRRKEIQWVVDHPIVSRHAYRSAVPLLSAPRVAVRTEL